MSKWIRGDGWSLLFFAVSYEKHWWPAGNKNRTTIRVFGIPVWRKHEQG